MRDEEGGLMRREEEKQENESELQHPQWHSQQQQPTGHQSAETGGISATHSAAINTISPQHRNRSGVVRPVEQQQQQADNRTATAQAMVSAAFRAAETIAPISKEPVTAADGIATAETIVDARGVAGGMTVAEPTATAEALETVAAEVKPVVETELWGCDSSRVSS